MKSAYLILENGVVFKGRSFGYEAEAIGELVFSTGMTDYLETLSDPAYHGQIVLQTFPLIGNYGVIPQDLGPGAVHLQAYIVRDWCQEPSNFRSEGTLDSFLRDMKIPGLYGIDTRSVTRIIRENGVMNAMVSKKPELSDEAWAKLRGYKITDPMADVCGITSRGGDGKYQSAICTLGREREFVEKFRVALWDFGSAHRLTEGLMSSGCATTIFGYGYDAGTLLSQNPDGVVLSGGPGDPAEYTQIIEEIKKLCGKGVPILAFGLGHQMLALANGARTSKLTFGHRGANQPVIELKTGRAFVTAQNHGYVVDPASLPENAVVSYENVNDGTCEGIDYTDIPAFSLQFDPTGDIFDKFAAVMNGGCA